MASIADDADAIFTPCSYVLTEVQNKDRQAMPVPGEIVSFRGRFCDQAKNGDRILAVGALEEVRNGHGYVRHRLLLGNSPEDTMIVLK